MAALIDLFSTGFPGLQKPGEKPLPKLIDRKVQFAADTIFHCDDPQYRSVYNLPPLQPSLWEAETLFRQQQEHTSIYHLSQKFEKLV